MFDNLNFNDLSTGAVMGLITVIFAVLGFVKGMVKLVFALFSIGLAILAAYWGYGNGHEIAANLVDKPEPWMSNVVALIAGIGVFSICRSISGFLTSGFNSTGAAKKVGFGPPAGFMGLLVGAVIAYAAIVGVRYLGSVAEVQYLDERLANPKTEHSPPLFAQLKAKIDQSKPGHWLAKYDIINDPEETEFAKVLVAKHEKANIRLNEESGQLQKLIYFDPELTQLAKEKNYAAILSHPKVSNALERPSVRETLRKFDVEKRLGLKTE